MPVLELLVWGPIGHIPSIDPECLAAIAYLSRAIPPAEWRLVQSNDPSVCPANRLPALRHAGTWTSGYGPIVAHLAAHTPHPSLDAGLTPAQRADVLAYSALLASAARPLLDAALYASEENWAAVTRPAYARLLPFPLSWLKPHSVRAAAVANADRCAAPRLLAALESDLVDQVDDRPDADVEPPTVTQKLASRLRGRGTEAGAGGDSVVQRVSRKMVADRLDEAVAEALAPFSDLLGPPGRCGDGGRVSFFESTPVSSLDCLAYGHFALMADLDLPRQFLRPVMARQKQHPLILRLVASVREASPPPPPPGPLDCHPPPPPSLPATRPLLLRCLDEIVRLIPALGEEYAAWMQMQRRTGVVVGALGLLLTGLVVIGGAYRAFRAAQPFGSPLQVWSVAAAAGQRTRLSRLSEFGAIGGAVGTLLTVRDQARGEKQQQREQVGFRDSHWARNSSSSAGGLPAEAEEVVSLGPDDLK